MAFPTELPDNVWGALTLIVIGLGSILANRIYSGGADKQTAQNTNDERSQVLIDLFTAEITELKQSMATGFAERDERISGLERAMERMRGKYYVALQHVRDLRIENPGTKLPIPNAIKADL